MFCTKHLNKLISNHDVWHHYLVALHHSLDIAGLPFHVVELLVCFVGRPKRGCLQVHLVPTQSREQAEYIRSRTRFSVYNAMVFNKYKHIEVN